MHPGAFMCGCSFIMWFKLVIPDKPLQQSLIQINDGEGDLARGPRRQLGIRSSLHHLAFIKSLNRAGTTAKPTALSPSLCVTKLARRLPI